MKNAGRRLENAQIAAHLREAAELLADQGADRFRVRAYRRGADSVETLDRDLAVVHEEGGLEALVALPAIGQSLARAIAEMLTTGRWRQLERLRGESAPEDLFQTIPGVGPKLAETLHRALHVETLEALEAAAHDGRMAALKGVGPGKTAAIRGALHEMLAHRRPRRPEGRHESRHDGRHDDVGEPDIALLLAVDARYRAEADAGALRRIAPKRFNPTGEAWLPVLHAEEQGWSFTALFSNTALAHELDRTHDWVVIYFERDGGPEHQRTVVTETRGPLEGLRVVRGREADCRAHYFAPEAADGARGN